MKINLDEYVKHTIKNNKGIGGIITSPRLINRNYIPLVLGFRDDFVYFHMCASKWDNELENKLKDVVFVYKVNDNLKVLIDKSIIYKMSISDFIFYFRLKYESEIVPLDQKIIKEQIKSHLLTNKYHFVLKERVPMISYGYLRTIGLYLSQEMYDFGLKYNDYYEYSNEDLKHDEYAYKEMKDVITNYLNN